MFICCLTHSLPYLPCFREQDGTTARALLLPKTEKIVPCVNRSDTIKDACKLI